MKSVRINVYHDTENGEIRQIVARPAVSWKTKFTPAEKTILLRNGAKSDRLDYFSPIQYSFDQVPAKAKFISERIAFGKVKELTYELTA